MGNNQKINHDEDDNNSQIEQQKQTIQFKQDDFIRQVQGSIKKQYEILSPSIEQNEFYSFRKVLHVATGILRSVYIINKYKIRSRERLLLQRSINQLKVTDHPYINKIYELFKDSHQFFVVCQLCLGPSLAALLDQQGHFEQKKTAVIIWQLLCVLSYLHEKGIFHTDFKFENIRFNSHKQQVIKVVDYSISRIFRVEEIVEQTKAKVNHVQLQALLCAPELLQGKQVTSKGDIWSVGMIMYILLSGSPQIVGQTQQKNIENLNQFQPDFQSKNFKYVSKSAKELIKAMLKHKPQQRPSAIDCLQYKWIKKWYSPPKYTSENLHRCLIECYNFNPSSKLQQATWGFFVNTLISFQQKNSILRIFSALDYKCMGQIDYQSLNRGFNQFYGKEQSGAMSQRILSRISNHTIKFSHFLTMTANRCLLINQPNILKIFHIFDDDGNGDLSVSQLRDILGSSKEVTPEIWLQLMKEVDANSDGMISLAEFKDMIQELLYKGQNYPKPI